MTGQGARIGGRFAYKIPQGLEALEEEKGFIAALKALRHPKSDSSTSVKPTFS